MSKNAKNVIRYVSVVVLLRIPYGNVWIQESKDELFTLNSILELITV